MVLELKETGGVKETDNRLYIEFRKNGTCRYTYYYDADHQLFFEADYKIENGIIEVFNRINEEANYLSYRIDLPTAFIMSGMNSYKAYKNFFGKRKTNSNLASYDRRGETSPGRYS